MHVLHCRVTSVFSKVFTDNRLTKWQWGLYEVAGIPEAFPGKTCQSLTHEKLRFM